MRLQDFIMTSMVEKGPKIIALSATTPTYQLTLADSIVIVTSSEADGTDIIYLPPVGEAAGHMFYISAPTGATAGDISVYSKESGADVTTYGDLDADDDHVIFFSDGKNWRVWLDGVA